MRTDCPRTTEVEKTEAASGFAPELAAHVAGCDECRDAALVAHALKRLADTPAGLEANPPTAGAIYVRSRLLNRLVRDREAYERAAWPLRAAAAAVVGLAATGLTVLTRAAGATTAPDAFLWVVAATPGLLVVSALLAVRD